MAREATLVQVGKHKVELSNLNKVLFPDPTIIKAEVIEYYLKVAPTILDHIKGRPLSLVRYPDGVNGERFFQKDRPGWAPDWVDYVRLGSGDKKDYIIATEEATLVWLANLACLELHQMHVYKPHFDKPDYLVFDLDPPEGFPFREVVQIALDLKDHVENYGYSSFVKTTGGKGIHLLAPIEPKWSFQEVFQAASDLAKPFVKARSATTTLHIKKQARKERVLVDIYRIRSGQTIIAPYSLKGNQAASVSMPLTWEQLAMVKDPGEFNLRTVLDQVLREGDAWEGIQAHAMPLHTKSKVPKAIKKQLSSDQHKTPKQLDDYKKKRDFDRTPEPRAAVPEGRGDAFVVHRHHASHLHYDLRLEKDGVLRSWAVPRGLPPFPGIKRLAVATEDHPLAYLNFEGAIPKGQYGGGDMWIFARGRYRIIKEKKDGFYFKLLSKDITAEYRIHLMKEKEWLLERVDHPQLNWLEDEVNPMLAESRTETPAYGHYLYEVKWDGIRAFITVKDGELSLRTRNNQIINQQFPELCIPEKAFRINAAVFDAEIVCFDRNGKPDFKKVIKRLQRRSSMDIERAVKSSPAFCYLFDCLYLDGRPIINEPLLRRRVWLKGSFRKNTPYRISEVVEEGEELFVASRAMGLEGIMAKNPQSKYLPGKRSDNWLKIKVRNTRDCLIVGYTIGQGDRNPYFGALHLAEEVNGKLEYRGKVGTGFEVDAMKEVDQYLKKLDTIDRPVDKKPLDEAKSTWVEPVLSCEIQYATMTEDGAFREPVFLRLRPDLVGSIDKL